MTIQIPIDKGIPCPPWKVPDRGKIRRKRRQWRLMEVGDSFFEAADERGVYYLQQRLSGAACAVAKRYRAHYETRIVDGGVRVWRTK